MASGPLSALWGPSAIVALASQNAPNETLLPAAEGRGPFSGPRSDPGEGVLTDLTGRTA
jgi:hypothetical protein